MIAHMNLLYSSFWMKPKIVTLWNVHKLNTTGTKFANHTSNPLESYNNRMNNNVFPCTHPSLTVFVFSLKSMAQKVVDHIDDMQEGRD